MQFELAPFALPPTYGDSIVPLADMKAHLSFTADETELDGLIGVYRDSAVDMVERYCGLRLGECSGLVWRGEVLPSTLNLGAWPVTSVEAIEWLDTQGNAVSGEASDWRVVRRDCIALKPGRVLPSGVGGGVEITFNAGFADDERPAALVHAVKMFTAHLFLNRETVITGATASEIPLGFRQLCGAYRIPVI